MTPARADAFGCSPFFAGISRLVLRANSDWLCVCARVMETSPLRALGKVQGRASGLLVHMRQKEWCHFVEILAYIDAICTNRTISGNVHKLMHA